MKIRCRVCGQEYDNCYACEKQRSWRTLTDTAEHYYILGVLMEYQVEHDAEKAYQALCRREIDIQGAAQFLPSVRKLIEEIYASVHENSRGQEADVECQE